MNRVRAVCTVSMGVLSACHTYRDISVADAKSVIHVCETEYRVVEKEFGDPDDMGMMGPLTTYTWTSLGQRMIIAVSHGVIVDVAVNPSGLVHFQNRCD